MHFWRRDLNCATQHMLATGLELKEGLLDSTRQDVNEHCASSDVSTSCRRSGIVLEWLNCYVFLLLHFCTPSFLKGEQQTSLNAVAALDGLRGYASLGVFTLHFTDTFCQMHNRGWGFDKDNHYFIQLPFVHFFWTAGSLVACFFVISGYVLSHRPLRLLHSRASDADFFAIMRSSIFRRGIRLYLPTVLATFIAMILVRVGVFDYAHWVYQNGYTVANEDTPVKLATFRDQFRDWISGVLQMTYLFRWGGSAPSYDPHYFTIPVEFQGSAALFFVTIGISKLTTGLRIAFIGALVLYCAWFDANEILLFFLGMFLADVDLLLRSPPSSLLANGNTATEHRVKHLRFLWLACFIAGFYLVGTPSWDPAVTPGYRTMMRLMPNWFRWETIGCGLLVWSVRNSHDLQFLFTNRFAQYLGNISFALYLVHGNVRRTITYSLMPPLLALTNGKESVLGYGITILCNAVVTYSVTIWLADMWWRGVDMPSVAFARWLEKKVCVRA